jgi:hypothetical protein
MGREIESATQWSEMSFMRAMVLGGSLKKSRKTKQGGEAQGGGGGGR